jgi:hypothetical protein
MNEPTANNEVKGSEGYITTHHLKTWPEYFNAILSRNKNFEYRVNDRSYQVGDILHLQEYDPVLKQYTGRDCIRIITYVMFHNPFDDLNGHAILSIYDPKQTQQTSALMAERQVLNSEIEELRCEVEKEIYRRQLAEQLIQWYTEGIYGDVAKMNYECVFNEWKSLKIK